MQMIVTLSGGEFAPVSFNGKDIVVEDDTITVDGDVIARWADHVWWWGDRGYDRAAVRVKRNHLPVVEFADEADDGYVADVLNSTALVGANVTVEKTDGSEHEGRFIRSLGGSAVRFWPPDGVSEAVNVRTITVH